MSAYMMVSQPSPALPHTLPFISSPDSPNVIPSTIPNPSGCESTPDTTRSQSTYFHSSEPQQNHQNHNADSSNEQLSDPDSQCQDRPLLETEGVVSSEVGAVPGILHQDLHPDGQPRRPMNAFMIFARHRRPAIQAKEPGLKTGEISKRLSHDWKNLPDEDKSHYLDQAKLLKDEFHNRFPEYVYKRRPNNTGKRRSSTSQQQIQTKFPSIHGGPQMMASSAPGSMGGLPHPGDMHHHPHHHPMHNDMYGQPGPHHHQMSHPHHHSVPSQPSRPPSSMNRPPSKVNGFYPSPNPSSPRYHQIGPPPQLSNGSQAARVPSLSQYPTSTGPPNVNGANAHLSRPPSPPSGHSGNGIPSYMRLPQPLTHQNPSQYSWFNNDQYAAGPPRQHSVSTPVSAGRQSFYYPSWPANGSESGTLQPEQTGQDQSANHNRAASYSGGTGLYQPPSPSPADRARQLSLPSHTLTASTEHNYGKTEGAYTGAGMKPEGTTGSPYGSTPSNGAPIKPDSHQLTSGPSPGYPNYPVTSGPNDSRSYSTSSAPSPIGPTFTTTGPRNIYHQTSTEAGSYDLGNPPQPTPQTQPTSSVAY